MVDYRTLLKCIGMNFRRERLQQQLSQEGFAELAGVHTNYIGKVERGEQNMTLKKVVDLANSLNVPLENILNIQNI